MIYFIELRKSMFYKNPNSKRENSFDEIYRCKDFKDVLKQKENN